MSKIKFNNGTTVLFSGKPPAQQLQGYCARCHQMELEYVDLHAEYSKLSSDYDKAQEIIGELQRQVKLFGGSY